MSDLGFVCHYKLLVVVFLAVHFEHDIDVFCRLDEALSEVLGNSFLNIVVDDDLLVVSLVIAAVSRTLHGQHHIVELLEIHLRNIISESHLDQLIIPTLEEMEGILVSELDEPQLVHYLLIHDSQIVVDSLVEYHVVNELVDGLQLSTEAFNPVDIDELEESIVALNRSELVDQHPKELHQVWVVVVDAEVEAVEQGHWVLLEVVRMLANALDDVKV